MIRVWPYSYREIFKKKTCGNRASRVVFFETFIDYHLHVLAQWMTPPARLYTWRTIQGREVDLVLESGRKTLAIEVKQTSHHTYRDANGIRTFLSDHPDAVGGLILHGGDEIRWMGERILAVAWTMITG